MKRSELIVQEDPKSPISEVIRTLRTNIQFSSLDKEIQTILVTSASPGDGKSFVSGNLAIAFAQAGAKTLLIDADLRKGRLHKMFKVPNEFGFSNFLFEYGSKKRNENLENDSNKRPMQNPFRTTGIDNLTLMTAGSIPPNPSELLGSHKMLEFLGQIRDTFDIIIFDGTPVNIVTDSLILSRIVDTTVLVASIKGTQMKMLEKAKESIEKVGGQVAGVVVNKMPITNKKLYGKYYTYYK